MSVYESSDTAIRGHVIQKEIDLYGSSRLGMLIADIDVDTTLPASATAFFTRGKKRYELVNHLGNVMVVISDVKKPIRSLTDTNLVVGYEPKVVTATDYYPFGMQMPGRHGFATESGDWHGSYAFAIPPHLIVNHRGGNIPDEYVASQVVELSDGFETGAGSDNYVAYIADEATMAVLDSAYQLVGGGYRYGFNGQEHDYDNGQDMNTALFWEYDGRTGRRWNIDPKPTFGISEYSTFQNNPITLTDPFGDVATIKVSRKQKIIFKDNHWIDSKTKEVLPLRVLAYSATPLQVFFTCKPTLWEILRFFATADTGIVGFKPLYNGNIAAMAVNIPKVGEPLLYNYSYDQLRLCRCSSPANLRLGDKTSHSLLA